MLFCFYFDLFFCFFFCKQKTAYEMRISDWSSDVCSSDLLTILVDVIDHDDPLTETSGIESLVDDLERRLLLTDHKQAAAGADRIGDHVDDRLALAGTRRPFHQQPATIARLQHSR